MLVYVDKYQVMIIKNNNNNFLMLIFFVFMRRLSQVMMIYLREMILGRGGESMSSEYWQELESSLMVMLEMKMALFQMMEMLRWMIVELEIQKMNFTNK